MASCASIVDRAIDGAAQGLGRAVSEHAANVVYKKMAPKEKLPPPATPGWGQFMAIQAQIVFGYAFAPGGLWISQKQYQPGDYTKYEMKDHEDDSKIIIGRAFLKKLDNGDEWWRTSWVDKDEKWIYEGLISPDGTLKRLRAKDADGNIGEIPVTGEKIYMEPAKISKESIKGATTGKESVKTPAGTFSADKVHYMAVMGEGSMDWWITPKVPGGVVKYELIESDKKIVWTNTLIEKGNNAKSILKSF